MKIILVGFVGVGKSSVAKKLSDTLDIKYIEMDDLVLSKSKCKSINEIFKKDGEECFRKLEASVAAELSNKEDAIIATGGGVGVNRSLLNVLGGVSIYLEAPFSVMEERLKNDKLRPLFKDIKKIRKLYKERKHLYEKNADHIISTDKKKIDNIVQEIIKKLFFMCEGGGCQKCSKCH